MESKSPHNPLQNQSIVILDFGAQYTQLIARRIREQNVFSVVLPCNAKLDEVKSEMQALRIDSVAVQRDIQNIYSILVRHDGRLERIERRLNIAEATT